MSETLLKLENVSARYGVITAVQGLNFDIKCGEIVTLIGANGAGKSTTLRVISGLLRPSSGRVTYGAEDITGIAAHRILKKGISHAPEGRGIFQSLTVEENLDLGGWAARSPEQFKASLEEVLELFPRLKERLKQSAGTLSGGEQQMLAIGRALLSKPALLLLDEPSLGLAPQLIERIFETLARVNQKGTAILLVEQNARQALQIAHRGVVLETGRIVLQGLAADLLVADEVRRAYLGE